MAGEAFGSRMQESNQNEVQCKGGSSQTNNNRLEEGAQINALNERTDRLGDLPDDLCTFVLSHMKAREAVQTCLVSKRWCKLWACMTSLDFDVLEFSYQEFVGLHFDLEKYQKFVNKFLEFRDIIADTKSFSVNCCEMDIEGNTVVPSYVTAWMLYALSHRVESLQFSLFLDDPFDLPESIFVSKTLENLALDITWLEEILNIELSKKVKLPNLKNLLRWTLFSTSLKRLSINGCKLTVKDGVSKVCNICAPNVEVLNMEVNLGREGIQIVIGHMPNLRNARIIVGFDGDYQAHLPSGLPSLEDLYLRLYCLRSRDVGGNQLPTDYFKEMLRCEITKLPTFINLKILQLGDYCMCCVFAMLTLFVNHCLNLKYLALHHFDYICEQNQDHNIQNGLQNIKFLCKHLKEIVVFSDCDMFEHPLIDLLAASTEEIENVEIIYGVIHPLT